MGHEVIQSATGIVMAIIGLAIFATLLNSQGTGIRFVQTASQGLAQDISAATAPVTGGVGTLGGLGTAFPGSYPTY